ncbi:MAG: sensor histidine kinase, partial [Acidimicrobiia bacterium]
ALMTLVVSIAAGTTLANVYFAVEPVGGDDLLDPVRDMAAWMVLLFLCWRLGVEAYKFQTEERRLMVQREIEERAMATRAAALTSTSHEVRTPLSAILAISETLLHEDTGPLTEIQQEFLQDIDDSAKHLMSLINDILDYAKAEAGMIDLAPETVAVPELVRQCVSMVEPRAKKNGVTVTSQVDSDVREMVADPLRLKQILLNLLSNAVKFNERDGVVNIRVRSDGSQVVVSVRDTGRGITVDQVEHLFDPYYQAAHSDQGIGTGLGLSIIKHLTELHGGSISADSVPGSGSVFTVKMPRVTESRTKGKARSSEAEEAVIGEETSVETETPEEIAV